MPGLSLGVGTIHWGSVAEWVSGLGALTAAAVALYLANQAQSEARETRRAVSRDRALRLLVDLIRAVESDIAASEAAGSIVRSPEAAGLCRALWGRRNPFGTAWHVYCEEDQTSPEMLFERAELFPRMREELQNALDAIDFEDRGA